MNKLCVVIGVKDYLSEALQQLPGCKADAVSIFEALTDPEIGGYDRKTSTCLISPKLNTLRGVFDDILKCNQIIDVFTFAFSGHGGVKNGNLFLCLEDTNVERLSTTGLSLSQVFTFLAEVAPSQSNIIIDACESGGVVADLKQLINPDLLGASDTPGVSIFAAAASDQAAKETEAGGYASTALLRCLRGAERVQTSRPYLNLIEVGNFVSSAVSQAASDQTPVVWGLNLFGDSFLANNPHFEGDMPPYSYRLARIPARSEAGRILQNEAHLLWQEYLDLPERLNARRLVDAISQPCEKLGTDKGIISSFVRGLSQSLPSHAAKQNDLFAEAQVCACCVVALLAFLNADDEAEDTILELGIQLSFILQSTLEESCDAMAKDRFALLSNLGGTNDLYILPIRISKILGWAAANLYIKRTLDINEQGGRDIIDKAVNVVLKNYANSLVAVSDCQSPFLLCALSELHRAGFYDPLEQMFGCVFNNYVENLGFIADAKMSPKKIPEFLLRRNSKNPNGARGVYAQPDELLSVILYVADKMKFEDIVDPYLEQIDHHRFNVFIPSDHTAFGAMSIHNGVNASFQIGYEGGMGVFTTSDFRDNWETSCIPLLNAEPRKNSNALKIAILLAAFLFPDRVPWLTFHTQ